MKVAKRRTFSLAFSSATAALFLSVLCANAAIAAPCANVVKSIDAAPEGYGAAFNPLSAAKEALLRGTDCDGVSAKISVGGGSPEQYVYKNGKYWDGSKWQDFQLSGSKLISGSWYQGEANGTIPLGDKPRFVLGHVCEQIDDSWKCGCSDETCGDELWQLQALGDTRTSGGGTDVGSCIAPPALSNPTVIDGVCPGVVDGKGKDLLIKMPKTTCTKQVNIQHARNVHLIGGKIVLDSNEARAVSLSYITGTVHIEGLHIDNNNRPADGISMYRSPDAVLTVQNTLIEGPGGTANGVHGDVIHTQGDGPLKEFNVENFSGYTSYQGIFTPFRSPEDGSTGAKRITLKNVNVAYDPRKPSSQKPLMLLFFGSATSGANQYGLRDLTAPNGTTLSNVFVDASRGGVSYTSMVTANPKPGSDGCATFDPVHNISGKFCDGEPKGGDFAPRDAVGVNYNRAKFCTN